MILFDSNLKIIEILYIHLLKIIVHLLISYYDGLSINMKLFDNF